MSEFSTRLFESGFPGKCDQLRQTLVEQTCLVDLAHDAILVCDMAHVIRFWNRGAEETYGWSKAEAVGQVAYQLLKSQFPQPREEMVAQLLWTGRWEGEIVQTRRDGAHVVVAGRWALQRDEQGRPSAILKICSKITEQKKAQADRDLFFSQALDLLSVAGFDGYFKRLNLPWEKALGYTTTELLARPYLEFVHPDDRQRTLAEAQKIQEGGVANRFENRYVCKDGTVRWLLWDAFGFPAEGLIYAAARDITERKRTEEEIRKLNETLERRVEARTAELAAINAELEAFAYSVSHDLRAPLRQIDGFVRILGEHLGPAIDPQAGHYLKRIQEGAIHMGCLVDDVLKLSRISRQELRRQRTDLSSLVAEALDELKPEMQDRRVDWIIERLPFVECDPALIKAVFTNLLSNALKFTRPRERAVIRVGQKTVDEHPVIFVSDNGVGFNMKYAAKLFGVFQRLHRPEDFPGTGVGLAIVRRILNKHAWRIWVEAELDRGATFYFSTAPATGKNPNAENEMVEMIHA